MEEVRAWAKRGPSPRRCDEPVHHRVAGICEGSAKRHVRVVRRARPTGRRCGGSALRRARPERRGSRAARRQERMRKLALIVAIVGASLPRIVAAWRRNPRIGTRFVNEKSPTRSGGARARGRRPLGDRDPRARRPSDGTRHLTPVHPVSTADGFRIIVPLGRSRQWARNVIAAGHCRMQLHDTVLRARRAGPAGRLGDAGRADACGMAARSPWRGVSPPAALCGAPRDPRGGGRAGERGVRCAAGGARGNRGLLTAAAVARLPRAGRRPA